MTKIYHNPRCRKSRETLELLKSKGEEIEIISYLEEVPSKKELLELIKLLGITPLELVRKNEPIWKEHYRGKALAEGELIEAMLKYPKLIERPIVVKNGKAALGRPPESVLEIL